MVIKYFVYHPQRRKENSRRNPNWNSTQSTHWRLFHENLFTFWNCSFDIKSGHYIKQEERNRKPLLRVEWNASKEGCDPHKIMRIVPKNIIFFFTLLNNNIIIMNMKVFLLPFFIFFQHLRVEFFFIYNFSSFSYMYEILDNFQFFCCFAALCFFWYCLSESLLSFFYVLISCSWEC